MYQARSGSSQGARALPSRQKPFLSKQRPTHASPPGECLSHCPRPQARTCLHETRFEAQPVLAKASLPACLRIVSLLQMTSQLACQASSVAGLLVMPKWRTRYIVATLAIPMTLSQ